MRAHIYGLARRGVDLAVPAQTEFLVDRASCRAEKQNAKNPNESVDEQLISPAAEIGCFSCASDYATFPPPENRPRRNRRWSVPSNNSPRGTDPAIRFPLREFRGLFARGPHCTAAARAGTSRPCVPSARP